MRAFEVRSTTVCFGIGFTKLFKRPPLSNKIVGCSRLRIELHSSSTLKTQDFEVESLGSVRIQGFRVLGLRLRVSTQSTMLQAPGTYEDKVGVSVKI